MRPTRIKGPQEALVTDQPGRKIFGVGFLIALILGFFVRSLINPQFVNSELRSAASQIHASTQITWSQAFISLKDGWLPRFSVVLKDVKIVSGEPCWGEPLLYSREIELPFSFLNFFEKGQPLRRRIVRDSFLEFKSEFVCNPKAQRVGENEKGEKPVQGPIRLKTPSETSSRPPVVLEVFQFENLKLRQPQWAFADWQLQTLRLRIHENSPWYAELESDFLIPETQGVDSRASLEMVYKEFPSQVLEADVRGHWREGTFRVKGQWAGPQGGWAFQTRFDHFPFQFLRTVALRTKTPWNWPDKPMWFSFASHTPQAFQRWKDSQHRVENLKVEGDLGDLTIPELQIRSAQPFKVDPFVFAVQNVDLSAGFSQAWKTPEWVQRWGVLSGQGQWVREDEFHFQGLLQNIEFLLNHKDRRLTYRLPKAEMQADLNRGQWRMTLDDFDLPEGSGLATLKVEGPQNMRSGRVSWSAEKLVMSESLLTFYEVLSTDSKWDWRGSYVWRDGYEFEVSSSLSTTLFESRDLHLEKPVFNVRKRPEGSMEFQLTSQGAALREPFSFFPDELRNLEYPFKLGRSQLAWSEARPGRWQLLSAKAFARGEIDLENNLQGTLSLGGQSFRVEGNRSAPLLRLNR
ncbi:MAG: hypothetical protein ACK5Y2_04750 [Bdellovibrionales bacterium]